MFNIAIGIVWQIALVALPIYIVIRTNIPAIWYCLAVSGDVRHPEVHLVRPVGEERSLGAGRQGPTGEIVARHAPRYAGQHSQDARRGGTMPACSVRKLRSSVEISAI